MPPSSSSAAAASLALSAPVLTVSIWELVAIAFTCWNSFAAKPASGATDQAARTRAELGEKARGVISHPRARPFGLAAALSGRPVQRISVAGAEGIEPPTFGFGDRRSAN